MIELCFNSKKLCSSTRKDVRQFRIRKSIVVDDNYSIQHRNYDLLRGSHLSSKEQVTGQE